MSSLSDHEELAQLEAEHASVKRQFRVIAASALAMLFIGAAFFHHTEHWSWLDAFYFCTITLTTVGYGDIVPKTNDGKLFDIFYVLVGVGIIAAFASTLLKNSTTRRQLRRTRRHTNKP